jgi:oxalate decarboxylase
METTMNSKQYDNILKALSRRNFLRTGSAVAMTALAGAAAVRAQERPNTREAEDDHSSSDPGPENKSLLDENPDSNSPPPTDHGDVVPYGILSIWLRSAWRKVVGPMK